MLPIRFVNQTFQVHYCKMNLNLYYSNLQRTMDLTELFLLFILNISEVTLVDQQVLHYVLVLIMYRLIFLKIIKMYFHFY